ncbi:efflux RND transporter periplasmic adaptor subunit [Labrys neptuniae]|uniref:Efflux RND transporter periplasmic adaptor subunit n=1 Tax=Labrys neptuniae TaxID=376174 RepID=A0ABV3PJR5_9HYPH|nr:efflux RND transporter periplasmic adaptor subunit [Labrys neptuniae]MDT3379498.1 efflux RND transporter periplasmic adaptor subunit [Labrys neptuniae]
MRIWKIATAIVVVAAAGGGYYLKDKPHLLAAGQELLAGVLSKPASANPAPAMQAMPVPVASVVKKSIPLFLNYPARTESIRSIALQAKVSGYMLDQAVPDGTDVKQGDVLYRIDARDYQAALAQVKAQAERDTAALDYAKTSLTRGNDLTKTGFLSKDLFDQRTSAVKQGEATLLADKAAIQAAELNLDYTEIKAPFDGRIGRNQAAAGTLVSPGGTVLNTLVQLSPIYVTFTPTEAELTQILKAKAAGKVLADIIVPGQNEASHQGELTFLDNVVDRATGTITARATTANADRSLLPGQYVNLRLSVGERPDTLLVPQAALGSSQLGKYVYVVGEGSKVEMRLVELGPAQGPLIAVTKGVKETDQIIVGNVQKIFPGVPVQPLPQKAGA